MRYVPMPPELADDCGSSRLNPLTTFFISQEVTTKGSPPKKDAKGERQRVEGSFDDLLERAGIKDFRFHDLRHTFA
jgi:integrase